MWLGEPVDVEVSRSASVLIGLQFFDDVSGEPLDLTGYTIAGKVAPAEGEASVYSPIVNISDPTQGWVDVTFDGAELDGIGGLKEKATAHYELVASSGGVDVIALRGSLFIIPGVQ